MALTSPGVEVVVIDESQYIPSAVNTVPYFVIATAQNKVSSDGVTVAAGTTAANANKTYLITSQRDLTATFGVPFFYNTTTGTPINGYELNEYGLLAAYSALGVTNRAYIQRADINLTDLTASLTRPTGNAANGAFWLDTSATAWGIQEWDQTTGTFTVMTPTVITDTADVVDYSGGDYTPQTSIGSVGDYAISAVSVKLQGYYKNSSNVWVQIGTQAWQTSYPTITGTNAPSTLTVGYNMYINGSLATVTGTNTVAGFAAAINSLALPGVTAAVVSGQLNIYANSLATSDGSTAGEGHVVIQPGPSNGSALLVQLGIAEGEYYTPVYFPGYSYQAPRWRTTDSVPRPTGSVWNNLSAANNGILLSVKKYSTALDTWIAQAAPLYAGDATAIYGLDPTGGGKNIPVGTTYAAYNAQALTYDPNNVMSLQIYERIALGATIVTGTTTPTGNAFVVGNTFTLSGSEAGASVYSTPATVTIGGTGTVANFISAVSAAAVPYVSASVNSAGNIVFTHSQGGTIRLINVTGTPVTTAGFSTNTSKVRASNSVADQLVLSNFVTTPLFTYSASDTAPYQDPADGRLWYYSSVDDVDVMIQDNGFWRGYQNVTNDVRGYDLSNTNATGPIVAATAPLTQTDTAESPLVYGDLWVNTSDLENYPKMYRWESSNGVNQWVEIDTTDQTTQSGILFADARWAPNGTTDPVADPLPTITSLLTSNYLDPDAPDPALYPQGMLLWNTRRSGYNVKSFQTDYFTTTATDYSIGVYSNTAYYAVNDFVSYDNGIYVATAGGTGHAPSNTAYWDLIVLNTWLTASGNRPTGAMYGGRQAQRKMIVAAMKSGIDTSVAAREEQNGFNIITTPAYPELTPNMIALSNERNNTLFVVADTPMRLGPDGNSLVDWATNNLGLGLPTEDGNIATSSYAGAFYPSCLTTDLGGNTVVQPPSHMMVRTILRSDAVSYPWLAPAGTRRGVVDNAIAIGYINATTGEFQQIGVSQSVRDILYERNINPITFIPGIGITNFGNKTTTTTTTALDRINVARLVCFLRGRLEEVGKLFLFEPNDQITRSSIANLCNSLMIDLVAKRAIYDYLVVCDLSNNTPARIDRNELWVDIAIEPVKAVEFIYIPLRIKNTGAISGA